MPAWLSGVADPLWRYAPAIIPMALLAAAFCRWAPCRPATRHAIWATILLLAIVVPFAPRAPIDSLPTTLFSAASIPIPDAAAGDPPTSIAPETSEIPEPEIAAGFVEEPPAEYPPVDGSPVDEIADLADVAPLVADERVISHSAFDLAPATTLLFEAFDEPCDGSDDYQSIDSTDALGDDFLLTQERSRAEPARAVGAGAPPNPASFGERDADRMASAPAASSGSAMRRSWAAWVAGLRQIRDAIGRLPAMPVGVWLAGVLALVGLHACATLTAWRRIRRSIAAPASIDRMVGAVADEMGLSTTLVIRFVDEAVSPMVCRWPMSRRAWLILPRRLWAELDPCGRRAIVCHELAHLRRGDHWFHVGQQIVGALYWWHPMVWWVRRRLSDESERCCDAWVTWLMPDSRRAYAQALLSAKQLVGDRPAAMPGVGMALTRAGAKRFARRITIVMTESKRPGLSVASVAIAATLALTAWVSRPAWACPDDAECKTTAPAVQVIAVPGVPSADDTFAAHMRSKGGAVTPAPDVPGVIAFAHPTPPGVTQAVPVMTLPRSGAGPVLAGTPAPPGTGPVLARTPGLLRTAPLPARTPAPPMARYAPTMVPLPAHAPVLMFGGGPEDDDDGDDDLEARMERLERQMQRLMQMMEHQAAMGGGHGPGASETPAPAQARQPRAPRPPREPRAPRADASEVVQRPYGLPEGKLEALIALMSRDDVPVLITPDAENGQLIVHGTEAQHRAFRAFVNLINPDGAEDHDHDADHEHDEDTPPARGASAYQRALEELRRAEEVYSRGEGAQNAESQERRIREAIERYRHALDATRAGAVQSREGVEKLRKELQHIERERAKVLRELKKLKVKIEKGDMSDADIDQQRALEEQELAMADQAASLATQMDELQAQKASLEAEAQLLAEQASAAALEVEAEAAAAGHAR